MFRSIVVLACALSLSACLSIIPEPEAPNALYRLGPLESDTARTLEASVNIRQPEAPRILAGTEMVARDAEGAIRLVENVEWADRSTRLLQLALLDHLGGTGEGLAVLPESGARTDYELSWRLSDFVLEGRDAIARIELTLLGTRDRKPIAQTVVSTRVGAEGSSNGARATALAEAGRQAVVLAADFLAKEISEAVGESETKGDI